MARALPHVGIIISGMMIVFFVIDRYNKKMRFMEDEMTKVLILILSISAIAMAIMLISQQRRIDRQRREKEA